MVLEVIRKRQSVRSYLDKEIPEDVLQKVLEAGRLAPSASNKQCWKFIVVKDE
nr:nitroreductase family protein [Actinomycetota bacterium]